MIHTIEGRVEPLVVVPPHVPVQVRAQPFHARADVVVHEFLPDETVGGFHHRVVVRAAGPGKGTRDTELGEHALHPFAGEPAAAVRAEHLDVRQGKRGAANAASTRSVSCPTSTEWPAICRLARPPGRQTYDHEAPTLT